MSVLTLNTSQQYLVDSAQAAATRGQIDSYLSGLSPSNKADLTAAVNQILPIVSAQLDTISRELKSVGLVLSDTMAYSQQFQAEVKALSFSAANNLLTKSDTGQTGEGKQVFLDNNFELVKQYRFKQSLADFYSKYSAHLQDRRERLTTSMQTLSTVHDNLTMILDSVK